MTPGNCFREYEKMQIEEKCLKRTKALLTSVRGR